MQGVCSTIQIPNQPTPPENKARYKNGCSGRRRFLTGYETLEVSLGQRFPPTFVRLMLPVAWRRVQLCAVASVAQLGHDFQMMFGCFLFFAWGPFQLLSGWAKNISSPPLLTQLWPMLASNVMKNHLWLLYTPPTKLCDLFWFPSWQQVYV